MRMKVQTMYWSEESLFLIDQRVLPHREEYVKCETPDMVIAAIKDMVVRGAPAIGVTAAYGLALGARGIIFEKPGQFMDQFSDLCQSFKAARPTAVNLSWAVDRMWRVAEKAIEENPGAIGDDLLAEAKAMHEQDIHINEEMGRFGRELIADGQTVLTHCNAGALATAGYGTALGVVRAAAAEGKKVKVFADETRPYLQGARLTAWEMVQEGIPVTVICDNMAGHFISEGKIDLVITGADRIAANGDAANKIGTLTLSVLAHEFGIPFYIAAPVSTFDKNLENGGLIPIEMRDPREISHCLDRKVTPEGVKIINPAFDVTPNRYITAIITEKGVIKPPFAEAIKKF
jgi:methylthioribose-1-phosphate isomerase